MAVVPHVRTAKPAAMLSQTECQADNSFQIKKERMQNIKTFGNSWRYTQTEHFKENGKICPSSLKQNFMRKFFLKNKEVKYSQRQDSNYFCMKGELNMQITRYRV